MFKFVLLPLMRHLNVKFNANVLAVWLEAFILVRAMMPEGDLDRDK